MSSTVFVQVTAPRTKFSFVNSKGNPKEILNLPVYANNVFTCFVHLEWGYATFLLGGHITNFKHLTGTYKKLSFSTHTTN